MTKLIKEAKRFQELAGIKEVKIKPFSSYKSEPGGNFEWWLPKERRDPNRLILSTESSDDGDYDDEGEYTPQGEDEYGPYNRPWENHGQLIRGNDGKFYDVDNGDYNFSGYIEGEDYIVIDMKNIIPLMQAFEEEGAVRDEFYDGYARYLEDNNGVLETNTPYWEKLVEIVGEENIPEYTRYLKNLGIKIV